MTYPTICVEKQTSDKYEWRVWHWVPISTIVVNKNYKIDHGTQITRLWLYTVNAQELLD